MPALPGYIPAKDSDYASWALNFSTLLTATPALFGLAAADAAAVAVAEAAWAAAYALMLSPATKTKAAVGAKNTERTSSQAVIRPYAQLISLNPAVSTGNKIAIGVNPRTSTPTQITAPTTYPVLSVPSAFPLNLVLRYRDELASPTVKSKPYGVTQIYVYASTSATAVTDPTLLMFRGAQTKAPATLTFDSADKGKTAYIAARWATRKGLLGPWSSIIASVVP